RLRRRVRRRPRCEGVRRLPLERRTPRVRARRRRRSRPRRVRGLAPSTGGRGASYPGRREQPGARLPVRRRRAALRRAGQGRAALGRGRARIPRLRRLVGPARARPRAAHGGRRHHRGRTARHQLRRADRAGGRPRLRDRRRVPLDGDGAAGVLRHGSGHERHPRRARRHRRDVLVKFDGCYHGHADSLLVKAGSGGSTFGIPDSRGVPGVLAALTLTLPFNDLAAVRELFAARGAEIAALIVEPVAGNMGVVAPAPGFLAGLREVTAQYGALLIFDEVITGFRVAFGGAQELYGVRPDLTCLGKIIGGGLPVGAYGGRRDVMDHVAPLGGVYQAGTLSGNPLAVAAGLATLRALEDRKAYARPQ